MPGDVLKVKGKIKNTGLRIGTTYLIVKFSDPYNHETIVFDTDRDFDETSKQTMRFVDIPRNGKCEFCVIIPIAKSMNRGILDIQFELWSPAKLFREASTIHNTVLFNQTPWRGGVEIINPPNTIAKVFISYSWHSTEHIIWVRELAEELKKHKIESILDQKDLSAGEEVTLFMETSVSQTLICIGVCSSSYTYKADNRSRGVGYEVSLLTNEILEGKKRALIIPIIKDNPAKKKPRSALYIDMDTKYWKGEPLTT